MTIILTVIINIRLFTREKKRVEKTGKIEKEI